jgi:hypothetical protein
VGEGFTGIRAPRGGAVPSVGLIPVKPTTPWDFTWHKMWHSSFLKNHVHANPLRIGWVLTRHHGINEGGLFKKKKWDAHLQGYYYILHYVRLAATKLKKNHISFYKSLE